MRTALLALAFLLAAPGEARGDEPERGTDPEAASEESEVERARVAFREGTELVARSDWAAALDAFERSLSLRPHPVTRYNIGVAERALGRYTRARSSLRAALEARLEEKLPDALGEQARTLLGEIDTVLVRVKLTVRPPTAALTVDGRPLEAADDGTRVAGTLPAGRGAALGRGPLTVILDPGAHVFVFSRKGFSDAVVNKTLRPGSSEVMDVSLDTLPATIHVAASQQRARVTVDGADVGFAPVDVQRPAGTYLVEVTKEGHEPLSTRVALEPGGAADLRAPLPVREQSIVEQWWFWTLTGVATTAAVTGVAVGTYFATRDEPRAPAPSGGSIGWIIDLR